MITLAQEDLNVSPVESGVELALFGDNIIEFNGQKFTPDDTKGYFQFEISTGFPQGVTSYGTGVFAGVVAQSYQSMLHQNINYEHRIKSYYQEPGKSNNIDDHVIGSVVAVDFPGQPAGGWRLDLNSAPAIRGVGVYHKQTTGMQQIVGKHQTGRHKYTVSMEANYRYSEAGFAVEMRGDKPLFDTTPSHFAAAGFDFVPVSEASDELQATLSSKGGLGRIVKQYRGRRSYLLMGGLNNPIHYAGVAIVKYGAERTAKITRLTASGESGLLPALAALAERCGAFAKAVLRHDA